MMKVKNDNGRISNVKGWDKNIMRNE